MDIAVQRTVQAVCQKVLATVNIGQARPDIQKILQHAQNQPDELPQRLIHYLEKEKLLAHQQLTNKGQKVLETGTLASRERGLYHIWYLDNDEHLGTRPLLLQRIHQPARRNQRGNHSFYNWPAAEQVEKDTPWHCPHASVTLIDDQQGEVATEIEHLHIEVIDGAFNQTASLTLQFKVSTEPNRCVESTFYLSGSLSAIHPQNGQQQTVAINLRYPQETTTPDFIQEVITSAHMHWNLDYQRARCTIPENPQEINTCVRKKTTIEPFDSCYGRFDSGTIQHIPLMPREQEAQQWQTAWLRNLYQHRYLSPQQARYDQQRWLSQPAIAPSKLPMLEGKALLNRLERQQYPQAFWHASAAHYLIPSRTKTLPPQVTLKQGTVLTPADLVQTLTLSDPVEQIIYSDRHYKSARHAYNMDKIAQLTAVSRGVVFTCSETVRLPDLWDRESVSSKDKDTHDRYWLFLTEERPLIWKCSNSFDFIDFRAQAPTVSGNTTFTQMDLQDLPAYLSNALNLIEDMEPAT